ncbi:MAG: VirB8/TrbF family protein [Alphaproteobacteria bacterium]|nr:VirB8/TrbF family protein [Alphaproteobacteria bacterium]
MATSDKFSKDSGSQTKNWYRDRYEAVITQRNFLGVIAISSLFLALIAGFIILYMLPQKTVMPFLIQVDEKSGYTTIIEQDSLESISADESLRRYFVIKFIAARESYDATDLKESSDIVRLLAERSIFRRYWNENINPSNKESLYSSLGADWVRQVEIKSVQFLDANRAQIRLSTITQNKKSSKEPIIEHYIALIKFQFTNLELKFNEMAVNPLGFQVLEYRLDKDSFL